MTSRSSGQQWSSPAVLGSLLAWGLLSFVVVLAIIGSSIRGGTGVAPENGVTVAAFTISQPVSGTSTRTPTAIFSGHGPPGATITIGSARHPQTVIRANGFWRTPIRLLPGENTYSGIARYQGSVITSAGSVTVTLLQ